MGVISVVTPPTVEPLTLDEAKQHLAVTFTDHDTMIQGMVRAARRNLEVMYGRAMLTQSLALTLDRFNQARWAQESYYGSAPATWMGYGALGVTWSVIELRSPVRSITSITYLDPAGVTQTLASTAYAFDPGSESSPGRVYPALGRTWPAVALAPASVRVEWVAGFALPEQVPDDWKAAVALYLGHLYANREQVVADARAVAVSLPMGVEALMGNYGQVLMR